MQQLQEEPSERSVINELAGNHPHESQRQTQAVELISDDDGSASVVLPPEYEDPPQEVSFDRDGLHVNATPAGQCTHTKSLNNPKI